MLTRLSHWGVNPQMNPIFAKRIILTNLLGLLFTINMLSSALVFTFIGKYPLALFTFFFVLTELGWVFFNRFGCYNVSRLGMLISSNLLGFIVSILLPDTGYNHGFYVMAGLPILLFSLDEKKSIILGLILPLALFPLSEWMQHHLPFGDGSLILSTDIQIFIKYSIGMVYVVLIFMMFVFLSKENAKSEEKLQSALLKVEDEKRKIETLNLQIEDQRARAFASAKFAALGEMASGISHEINNPMAAIDLNVQNLKHMIQSSETSMEDAQKRLDVITKTISRVGKIIHSMRTFSREASQDPFELESFQNIVDDTLTFCSERFKNHHIKLEVKVSEENLVFNCRPVQISQVLLNLLNNAFDAVENLNDKWICLEANIQDDQISICITDSGSGIPENEHEKIFQPFYTTKAAGKGTGLGLSLSRQIVQDHGGTLNLNPHHAHTQFIIKLPRT